MTVNQQADALAEKIIADLGEMTRTILYDFRDLHRQLRMLIILGKVRSLHCMVIVWRY